MSLFGTEPAINQCINYYHLQFNSCWVFFMLPLSSADLFQKLLSGTLDQSVKDQDRHT